MDLPLDQDSFTLKTKVKKIRNESNPTIDPLNLNAPVKENQKLDANRLVAALDEKVKDVRKLKKQIIGVKKRQAVLKVPLHKQAKERVERMVAYDEAKKRVDFWDETVRQNRLEDHLVFPLQRPQFEPATLESAVERFTPKTSLELETAKILASSKNNLSADVEYTEAEKEALKALSLEEAERRKEQLCRMRALISYKTALNRRKNAIKSKRYHRIAKKRQRKDVEKQVLELLRKNDPKGAKEKLELLELDRIKERSTLKHRSTGKWAKQIRQLAKKDPQLREALQTQLRLGKEIAEKVFAVKNTDDNDDQSEGAAEESDPEETTGKKQSASDGKLPKSSAPVIDLTPKLAIDSIRIKENVRQPSNVGQSRNVDQLLDAGQVSNVGDISNIGHDDADPDPDQNQLISEAFADDDVIEREIDEAMKDSDDEKDPTDFESAKLPGWNSWVGPGLTEQRRQRAKQRLAARSATKPSRRRKRLVKFSDKANESVRKLQVKQVPFPFRDPRLFEEYADRPLGKEWNTQTAHKMLIEPAVKTKMGAIIQPMDADYVLQKTKRKSHVTQNDDKRDNKRTDRKRADKRRKSTNGKTADKNDKKASNKDKAKDKDNRVVLKEKEAEDEEEICISI